MDVCVCMHSMWHSEGLAMAASLKPFLPSITNTPPRFFSSSSSSSSSSSGSSSFFSFSPSPSASASASSSSGFSSPYPSSPSPLPPPSKKTERAFTLISRARRTPFSEILNLREENNVAGDLEYETPLKVILYPDPRLRAKNKRITVFDEKLEKLVKEMFDVMYETDGVGLSAPQVGVNVQLMVFNPEGEKGKGEEIVLVNPRIFKYSNKRTLFTEGCLSFPEIEADVERPLSVKVEAQDIKGKKFDMQLKEFPARIFQHEYDHLQSVLFFERMSQPVLNTIIPGLQKLEDIYEQKTGLPAPERVRVKSKM